MIDAFRGPNYYLSNFYPVNVTLDGVTFRSVEHSYQAAKTLDWEDRARIQRAESPAVAKHIGKMVKLRPDWDTAKFEIMKELLRQKFEASPLRERLLATGQQELIEGNTHHDRVWGVCKCNRCRSKGEGENWLGKLLMDLRRELAGGAGGAILV